MDSSTREAEDKSVKTKIVRNYCTAEFCEGVEVEAEPIDLDGDMDCAVCYESLTDNRIALMSSCSHYFCPPCIYSIDVSENGCPMCRQISKSVFVCSEPVKVQGMEEIDKNVHKDCIFNESYIKERVISLNDEWMSLVRFMSKWSLEDKYVGINGMEEIKMQNYEPDDVLLESDSYFVFKDGSTNLAICCQLPFLSIKLLISPSHEVDFDVDNTYADEVVGFLNKQISACWRALPRLMPQKHLDRIYVRKFGDFTASLLLLGFQTDDRKTFHHEPMKESLENLKKSNFEEEHFMKMRKKFPRISLELQDLSKFEPLREPCCVKPK